MPITFSEPIRHGAGRPHTVPLPPIRRSTCPPGLAIRTLNIRDYRGFGLSQAIRSVEHVGFDIILLTEKKHTTGCNTM